MKHKTHAIVPIAILASLNIAYAMDIMPVKPVPKAPASECNLPKRDLKEEEVPSNYVHCPIAQQIKFYRENVYDPALQQYQDNVEDIKTKSLPGLSLVMENAFALVNDYIKNDSSRSEDGKKRYIDLLENLWRMVSAEIENGLTSAKFQHFNEGLARLIDAYKENDHSLKNLGLIFTPYDDKKFEEPRKNVVFIIYGSPNPKARMRSISTSHFVEQYCNPAYSAYIVFFDVLSMKREKPTKKDPHWSLENGTYVMLKHDFDHIYAQIVSLSLVKHHIMYAYQIAEDYKNKGNLNAYKVLMDFLFLITHEVSYDPLKDSPKEYFKEVIINFSKFVFSGYEYGSKFHKQELRDWESVLKATYKDPTTGEIKVVHDQEGKPFFPVQWDPIQQKVTRPFSDSPTRKSDMKTALSEGWRRYLNYVVHLLGVDLERAEN